MSWVEDHPDPENEHHVIWTLVNDVGAELATIEHFCDGNADAAPFYLWAMHSANCDEMIRIGPQSGTLEQVKARAERLIAEGTRLPATLWRRLRCFDAFCSGEKCRVV